MGHMFSTHTPNLTNPAHYYPHTHIDHSVLNEYKGFEEDGDPKLWVEERCAQTAGCLRMKDEYDACVERISGKDGGMNTIL